jgi:hypothetical protein
MLKKINWKTISFVLIALCVVFVLYAPDASAAIVNCGNDDGGTVADGCKLSDLFTSAANLINYMLSGGAVVATGGVVYGGYLMVTSAGDAKKQGAGKKAVTNSLIGLGIILGAYLLVKTVFSVLGFKGGTDPIDNPVQFTQPGGGIEIAPVPGYTPPGSTPAPTATPTPRPT